MSIYTCSYFFFFSVTFLMLFLHFYFLLTHFFLYCHIHLCKKFNFCCLLKIQTVKKFCNLKMCAKTMLKCFLSKILVFIIEDTWLSVIVSRSSSRCRHNVAVPNLLLQVILNNRYLFNSLPISHWSLGSVCWILFDHSFPQSVDLSF